MNNSYQVTETITQHFLVDDSAREEITVFMTKVKAKVHSVKTKVKRFASRIDELLDDVLSHGREVGAVEVVKLAVEMNRSLCVLPFFCQCTDVHVRMLHVATCSSGVE